MTAPAPGTVWEIRYRVRGPSAVWDRYTVCEVVSGPDKGATAILLTRRFEGPSPTGPSGEGPANALARARRRHGEEPGE